MMIPTMDSTRAEFLMNLIQNQPKKFSSFLSIGGPGTAKTTTTLMYCNKFNIDEMLLKIVNYSSATSPEMLQNTIENELERKTGRI